MAHVLRWTRALFNSGRCTVRANDLTFALEMSDWDEEIAARTTLANEAMPGIRVEPANWREFLARRMEGIQTRKELAQLDFESLYLVCACLEDNPVAHRLVEEKLFPEVRRALSNIGLSQDVASEVIQELRRKTLWRDIEGGSRLNQYQGRGPLVAWLRTVSVRLAADVGRLSRPTTSAEEAFYELHAAIGVETALIQGDVAEHFKKCFLEALNTLSVRERHLLKLSLVEHLSIDQIAPMYAVSRATVARWIQAARTLLASRTRERLSTQLSLSDEQVDSLIHAAFSQVSSSVIRYFMESNSDSRKPT